MNILLLILLIGKIRKICWQNKLSLNTWEFKNIYILKIFLQFWYNIPIN